VQYSVDTVNWFKTSKCSTEAKRFATFGIPNDF
jgi:hypothetical protein